MRDKAYNVLLKYFSVQNRAELLPNITGLLFLILNAEQSTTKGVVKQGYWGRHSPSINLGNRLY